MGAARVGAWHCSRSQYSQLSLSPLLTKHHGRVSLSGFLQSQQRALLVHGESLRAQAGSGLPCPVPPREPAEGMVAQTPAERLLRCHVPVGGLGGPPLTRCTRESGPSPAPVAEPPANIASRLIV